MALSALDDLSAEPTGDDVARVLGERITVWEKLMEWMSASAGVDSWEWGSSGKKYGWGLRGKSGKRNIAYLIPQYGSFLVGIVLGDRAMQEVRHARLSAPVLEIITSAKRYGEGTGFRLPVTGMDDLEDLRTLIGIKIRH